MVYSVNEPVSVVVVFGTPGLKPLRFSWRGASYGITKINFRWKNREKGSVIHRFAVSDGVNGFQLAYDSEHLTWKLEAVDLEG